MSYLILALGILLALAGCLSIFTGYQIIEVERGWTEVIAGMTAVSGGIITIALAAILHRLKIISGLQETRPLAAPAPLAFEPRQAAVPSIPPAAPAVSSIPAAVIAHAAPEPVYEPVAIEPAAPLHPAEASYEHQTPHDLQTHEPETAYEAEPLYEPEPLYEAEPAAIEAAAVSAIHVEPSAPHEVLETLAIEEAAAKPASASSLSLDEMWKRVTAEMEKPFTSPREDKASEDYSSWLNASETAAGSKDAGSAAPAPAAEASHEPTARHEEPVSAFTAVEEATVVAALGRPFAGSSQTQFEPALEEPEPFVEAEPTAQHHAISEPDSESLYAPEPVTPAHEFEPVAAVAPFHPDEPETPAFTQPPRVEAPAVESAVIGRYEADGTAYIMFADGSIEAQSEAGIFRFASMSDLKAFIEERQAVAETALP